MYISFSATASGGLGGAAQGVIPVQDAQGNMLGGSAPASPELRGKVGQARREAKEVKGDVARLEEYFERMMEAVGRNTEQIAALAENQAQQKAREAGRDGGEEAHPNGYFDAGSSELSAHLGRINDLLARNSAHVEGLAKRQNENDEKLRATLQEFTAKQQKDDDLDLSQLSAHLDRIQVLMEQQSRGPLSPTPAPIDFSPLTDRLEKVQQAVEQNSALVKALLDEGTAADSKPGTPFWGKDTPVQPLPPSIDLSPLTEHLQKIHGAIEQQSQHIQALVGFASGGPEDGGDTAEKSLAPLGEHLEQIYNAVEEGNKLAKQRVPPPLDLQPLLDAQEATRAAVVEHSGQAVGGGRDMGLLAEKLDGLIECLMATHSQSQAHDGRLQELVRKQNDLHAAVTGSGGSKAVHVDLAPLVGKFDGLGAHLAPLGEKFDGLNAHLAPLGEKFDGLTAHLSPLAQKLEGMNEHLESLREWAEYNAELVKELVDVPGAQSVDLTPLTGKFDGLSEHLEALRSHAGVNIAMLKQLLEAQQSASNSARPVASASEPLDLTPLTERLNRIHDSLEQQAQRRASSPGSGDPKFIMSALTSHLSKIQAVTEANAQHVKSLREKQSASQDKMHIAVSQTADTVRSTAASLTQYHEQDRTRVETMEAQMRELMAGQREVVEVMREVARSLAAANKGSCAHVVVPPPRKMGRKVVGFVYDAKDGAA